MSLINFEELESVIKDVETVFKHHNLVLNEKWLVIEEIKQRCNAEEKKILAGKTIESIPLGGLMKRLIKSATNPKDDSEEELDGR